MHAFKCYASSYNVELLNLFNPDVQLKDSEFSIKNNFKILLSKLRGFTFVTTLVLFLRNIRSEDKRKYGTFHSHLKSETILIKVTLMIMYLNQSILQLYQR